MGRIIKSTDKAKFEAYDISEFSSVKRGQNEFHLNKFSSDEISVQDGFMNPSKKATKRITVPENPDKAKHGTEYVSNGFQEMELSQAGEDEVKVPGSQKELAERNAEKAKLNGEIEALKEELEKTASEAESLRKQLEDDKAALPALLENASNEGYEKGKSASECKYVADKDDYLKRLDKFYKDALDELKKVSSLISGLDSQIPSLVTSYVREIIGAERRINDNMVVNLIQQAMSGMQELNKIILTVNPEDEVITKESFPNFTVETDSSILKGAVKMRTKVGEIDLDVNKWIDNLEKQIDEKFRDLENNNS